MTLNKGSDNAEKAVSARYLTFLLSFLFLLIKAVNNLLYLSVLTVFLEKAGANTLPWVYLLVNVCFIIIQFRFITNIAGFEGHWLLEKVNLPMILVSFIAAWFLPSESVAVLIGFLVTAMLSDLVSNQAFTAMLNHFLSLGDSKRILPFIFASGSLGYILSGLTLKFVVDLIGFSGLLVLNGLIAVVAASVVYLLRPFEQQRLQSSEAEDFKEKVPGQEKIEASLQHPLARLLIVSSFLIIFNRYLIDFLFAGVISAYFSSGKDLASFMGIFGASADLLVIGLQAFVMQKVFSSLPVGRVLTFVPAILTLLCLLASFNMKFAIVALVQFLVMINSKNFTVPATTLLMGAIPQKNRVVYRRDISIACAIASTVVGVFLLVVRNHLLPETLFFVASALYLAMALVHYLLDRAYLMTLKSQILSREIAGDAEQISSIRYLQQKDRLEQLKILLQSENIETRILAVREAGELSPENTEKILQDHLTHEIDSRCVAEIARILVRNCGSKAFASIENLIDSSEDCRLKADLIEALGKLRGAGEGLVQKYLSHFHHRVKASAIICLLRISHDREKLEAALRELSIMASSGAEMMRASAAAVMGELGLPLFIGGLEQLAFEENPTVALSAVNAISRIQAPAALVCLQKLKNHSLPRVAEAATKLGNSSAQKNIEQIGRLLTSITAEERVRLASRIRKIGDQENSELLALLLCVEEVRVRKNLIKILEKADEETVELISRCLTLGRNDTVNMTLAPAFSLCLDEFYVNLPAWADVVIAIGSGSLKDPGSSFSRAARYFIHAVWAENLEFHSIDSEPDQKELMQKRNLAASKIFCCLGPEPMSLIKSLDNIHAGTPYARSLALEYLESNIGKPNFDALLPLIDLHDMDAAKLSLLAQEKGIEISDIMRQNARSRVDLNLKRQVAK